MAYVDGFVIAVPKDKLDAYKAMARDVRADLARAWRHGLCRMRRRRHALWRSDLFPRAVQAKEDEVVIFSWIVYELGASARDAVNKKAIEDPRLKKFMKDIAL